MVIERELIALQSDGGAKTTYAVADRKREMRGSR